MVNKELKLRRFIIHLDRTFGMLAPPSDWVCTPNLGHGRTASSKSSLLQPYRQDHYITITNSSKTRHAEHRVAAYGATQ